MNTNQKPVAHLIVSLLTKPNMEKTFLYNDPFFPIRGRPLYYFAAQSFLNADQHLNVDVTFVTTFYDNFNLSVEEDVKKYFPSANVVILPEATQEYVFDIKEACTHLPDDGLPCIITSYDQIFNFSDTPLDITLAYIKDHNEAFIVTYDKPDYCNWPVFVKVKNNYNTNFCTVDKVSAIPYDVSFEASDCCIFASAEQFRELVNEYYSSCNCKKTATLASLLPIILQDKNKLGSIKTPKIDLYNLFLVFKAME